MQLHLHPESVVDDLQDKVNECFPFLQIRFYAKNQKNVEDADQLPADSRLREINPGLPSSIVEIRHQHKIRDVLHELKSKYRLYGQLFWLNGENWEKISSSEARTIEDYRLFSELSKQQRKTDKPPDPEDEEVHLGH